MKTGWSIVRFSPESTSPKRLVSFCSEPVDPSASSSAARKVSATSSEPKDCGDVSSRARIRSATIWNRAVAGGTMLMNSLIGQHRRPEDREPGGVRHRQLQLIDPRRQVVGHDEARLVLHAAIPDEHGLSADDFVQRCGQVAEDMGIHLRREPAPTRAFSRTFMSIFMKLDAAQHDAVAIGDVGHPGADLDRAAGCRGSCRSRRCNSAG